MCKQVNWWPTPIPPGHAGHQCLRTQSEETSLPPKHRRQPLKKKKKWLANRADVPRYSVSSANREIWNHAYTLNTRFNIPNDANCFDIKRRDPGSRFGNIYVFLLLGFVRSTGSEAGVWRPVASVRATRAVFPRSVVWRFGESWLAYPLLHVVNNSDVWMKKANSEAGVSELGQVSLKRHIMFAQYGGP